MRLDRPTPCPSLLSIVALLTAVACVAPSVSARPGTRGDANDIRVEEIRPILWRAHTADEVIRLLRPAMLAERDVAQAYHVDATGGSPQRHIPVYVDGLLLGDKDALATIPARAVLRVQRLTPPQAASRFGTGIASDVIAITTYAGR